MEIAPQKTDKEAKQHGRPFKYGTDAVLIIAASGNTAHKRALRRLYEPHAKAIANGGQLEPEAATAVDDEAMAEAVLLGWQNISENDQPVPYTKENALRLLQDYDDVRSFVLRQCENAANFTVGAVEAAKTTLKKS